QVDFDEARRLDLESLTLRMRLGEKSAIVASLEAIACLDVVQDRPDRAVRLFGAAAAQREAMGAVLPPPDRVRCDRHADAARTVLGQKTFAAEWEEGR